MKRREMNLTSDSATTPSSACPLDWTVLSSYSRTWKKRSLSLIAKKCQVSLPPLSLHFWSTHLTHLMWVWVQFMTCILARIPSYSRETMKWKEKCERRRSGRKWVIWETPWNKLLQCSPFSTWKAIRKTMTLNSSLCSLTIHSCAIWRYSHRVKASQRVLIMKESERKSSNTGGRINRWDFHVLRFLCSWRIMIA